MDGSLLLVQLLNGIQVGILLFLVASGLTLVFGILDVINLAHGALFMVGAYAGALAAVGTGSVVWALIAAPITALLVGIALDRLVLRQLYDRDHLDQVLATFGCLLFLNELARAVFGPAARPYPLPTLLEGSIGLPGGVSYPVWRLAIILVGCLTAAGLSFVLVRTRFGMLVRAAATNAPILEMLGVDVRRLCLLTFGMGAALAGFAGAMAGPIVAIQPGMGDQVLILAFVVIVTGGTGSVRGALAGSLLVGLADTLGRSFLTDLARLVLPPAPAAQFGPAIASMMVYLVMAVVLLVKPQGLLPVRGSHR
ncbi:MAG: branched-chain amino acid ABC transporter permease [Geminicoccaceae bacterium]|nr:branched-chain amino acid ABC transporter permease [Geminicoccaceae bacterium]